jgi:enamine deaminase RidA (YjgF/YER057c/UK114 family)
VLLVSVAAYGASTVVFGLSKSFLLTLCALAAAGFSDTISSVIRQTLRQKEAFSYGSAFSRGVVIERAGHRTIHVSGTASIGSDGESLHRGDAAAQGRETLDAVSAVLATEGAGLGDIAMSTLFCKDRAAYEAWRTMIASAGRPEFPMIAVLADVCRPELLVELEALAVV